ncbi:MAG: hypothetical protein PHE33_09500 [Bacteroidales bacterium]|nr:hypothetical protein [Bacteroidales bacterium]
MKNFNKLFFIVVIMIITTNIIAQSIQMPKWPLNGKEIDFTGTNITVNNLNSYLSGACGATNGYYDESDNLFFHIIDTKLYSPDGTMVGDLYIDNDNTPDEMGAEIIVVPVEPSNNCLYYVIYPIQQHNDDNTHVWKVCYNLVCWYGPTIIESGVLCSEENSMTHGGIAISDFVNHNGDTFHILQVVGKGPLTHFGQYHYVNGEMRLLVRTILPNAHHFDFCELDMSKDGKVLAAAHMNINQFNPEAKNLRIWCFDDNLGSPQVIHDIDLGVPGLITEQFTGVEVYQHPDYPNRKNVFCSRVGGTKYISIIDGNSLIGSFALTSTNFVSNSQLELDRHGYLASTCNDNRLQEINPISGVYEVHTIGQHNAVRNDFIYNSHNLAPLVYTLPDQVDQADYSAYTIGTEFDCCEVSHLSAIKTPNMPGVSHASNGDIIITGSSVSWTQASNPFTSGGQPITDIYLKGELKINQGAKLKINGLTLHFKEGEILDMSYNASGVGSRLELRNSKLTVFDDCAGDVLWGGVSCSGN